MLSYKPRYRSKVQFLLEAQNSPIVQWSSTAGFQPTNRGSNPLGTNIEASPNGKALVFGTSILPGSNPGVSDLLRSGLEEVPAQSHKLNDVGSSPTCANSKETPS